MKSTLTNDKTLSERNRYPYIGTKLNGDNKTYTYVLFIAQRTGVVIFSENNDYYMVGDYSENWDDGFFTVLDHSTKITLQNN
jgi:hypothetical protein